MTLRIRRAVSEGLSLLVSRNAAVLIAVFLAIETFTLLLLFGTTTRYVPLASDVAVVGEPPLLEEAPPGELVEGIASVLTSTFSSIVAVPVIIVALRTFVLGVDDRFTDAVLFHRMGRSTAHLLVATLVLSLIYVVLFAGPPVAILTITIVAGGLVDSAAATLVGMGAVLLALAAGIVLVTYSWLMFTFVSYEIAVQDATVVAALRGSWRLVRGSRVRLFALVVGLYLVQTVVLLPTTLIDLVLDNTWLAMALVLPFSAGFTVFWYAILACAYRQLVPDFEEAEARFATGSCRPVGGTPVDDPG